MIVRWPSRALRRGVQRDRFFGDALRIANQIERLDEFVALQHVLAAEAIGIRTLLNFVARKAGGHDSRAGLHLHLMNRRADAGDEKLLDAAERPSSLPRRVTPFTRRISLSAASSRSIWRSTESRTDLSGTDSARCRRRIARARWRRLRVSPAPRLGDGDGLRGAGLHAFAREPVGGGEAPASRRR